MSIASLAARLRDADHDDLVTSSPLTAVDAGDGSTVEIVRTPPAELARKAGVPLEVYSLARCIRSEGYSGKGELGRAAAAVAIGQVIRNGASRSGKTITAKLTYSTIANASGFYGRQRGRYAATTSDPARWHIEVAQAVLNGHVQDLARGATKFLAPAVWGEAARKGQDATQAGRKLAQFESVVRAWILDEGNAFTGPIPAIDPYHLALFRKDSSSSVRRASLEDLLEVYSDGVAGKSSPAPGHPDSPVGNAVALASILAMCGLGVYWLGWGQS